MQTYQQREIMAKQLQQQDASIAHDQKIQDITLSNLGSNALAVAPYRLDGQISQALGVKPEQVQSALIDPANKTIVANLIQNLGNEKEAYKQQLFAQTPNATQQQRDAIGKQVDSLYQFKIDSLKNPELYNANSNILKDTTNGVMIDLAKTNMPTFRLATLGKALSNLDPGLQLKIKAMYATPETAKSLTDFVMGQASIPVSPDGDAQAAENAQNANRIARSSKIDPNIKGGENDAVLQNREGTNQSTNKLLDYLHSSGSPLYTPTARELVTTVNTLGVDSFKQLSPEAKQRTINNLTQFSNTLTSQGGKFIQGNETQALSVDKNTGLVTVTGNAYQPASIIGGGAPFQGAPTASHQMRDGVLKDLNKTITAMGVADGDTSPKHLGAIATKLVNNMRANAGDVGIVTGMAQDAASKYGINPQTFTKLIKTESNFNPKAVSRVGAQGLGQLMPATAAELGLTGADVTNPEKNLDASAKYFSQMQQQVDHYFHPTEADRDKLAAVAYNMGIGNLLNYIQGKTDHFPDESKQYTVKIFGVNGQLVANKYRNAFAEENKG